MAGEEGATDAIYPNLCKAFDNIPLNILVSKLETHGFADEALDKNWLDGLTALTDAVNSSSGDQWQLLFLRAQYWDHLCLKSL